MSSGSIGTGYHHSHPKSPTASSGQQQPQIEAQGQRMLLAVALQFVGERLRQISLETGVDLIVILRNIRNARHFDQLYTVDNLLNDYAALVVGKILPLLEEPAGTGKRLKEMNDELASAIMSITVDSLKDVEQFAFNPRRTDTA
jgi:hypothetical protein